MPPHPLRKASDTAPPTSTRILARETEGPLLCWRQPHIDWGREFHGREAIRSWSDAAFIEQQVTQKVSEAYKAETLATLTPRSRRQRLHHRPGRLDLPV
ncbi:hypothetical protein [Streptomyces zagrosensis]|uniref:Uncharacterized protein n=1 Tax=Streptomyces zagrosensis TaxID=1042984 RepID=A0A7W9QGH2_9ACTN|nr:hypothetical protein [Streptomyces zagrosensis]MBB5939820.1 hypothetical protein [Streptomyces zagrosensis]